MKSCRYYRILLVPTCAKSFGPRKKKLSSRHVSSLRYDPDNRHLAKLSVSTKIECHRRPKNIHVYVYNVLHDLETSLRDSIRDLRARAGRRRRQRRYHPFVIKCVWRCVNIQESARRVECITTELTSSPVALHFHGTGFFDHSAGRTRDTLHNASMTASKAFFSGRQLERPLLRFPCFSPRPCC